MEFRNLRQCQFFLNTDGRTCFFANLKFIYRTFQAFILCDGINQLNTIAIEAIVIIKDLYYTALNQSQYGWHEGTEDAVPFIKYLLSTILAAYKDFSDRFEIVAEKLPAIDMVRKATQNKIGRFTKQDIRELCPSLSLSSVEGALRKLVASGELKREGAGKNTCYIRLM